MKNIIFPNDRFFDFATGANVSDYQTTLWINDCLNKIKEKIEANPELPETFYTISSGNTKVIVEAYRQERNTKKYTVYISVAKSFQHYTDTNFEF